MINYKRALGLIAVVAILAGVFCASEAEAGGKKSTPFFGTT